MTCDALGHPHSSYGTPEDVLIAFALKNFSEFPILGDCAQAQEGRDSGKVCWTLESGTGERRIYTTWRVSGRSPWNEVKRGSFD